MKQQKLVQIQLGDDLGENECVELRLQQYLKEGWKIVAFQVCPKGGESPYSGDVVVLLEKEQ